MTWLVYVHNVTHLCVWRDFVCVIWLIHMRDMTYSYVWHDLFTCVTWLIQMCDMTYSHVWHDSFICVTWLIHIGTWLFRMCYISHAQACDMTYSHVCHDYLFVGETRKKDVTWLMWYDDVTHFICVTWWVQLVKVWGGQNTTWAPVTRLIHELSIKKQTERELLEHDSSIVFPKKMSWLIQCFFYINKKDTTWAPVTRLIRMSELTQFPYLTWFRM